MFGFVGHMSFCDTFFSFKFFKTVKIILSSQDIKKHVLAFSLLTPMLAHWISDFLKHDIVHFESF